MKQILILSFFLVTATYFFMSSCKKDLQNPVTKSSSHDHPIFTYILVASNWDRDVNGFFVSRFKNFITTGCNSSNRNNEIKVYVITTNGEIQINQFIFFMGGELWAETISSDLLIYFRYSGNTHPFSYLNIKVVVG